MINLIGVLAGGILDRGGTFVDKVRDSLADEWNIDQSVDADGYPHEAPDLSKPYAIGKDVESSNIDAVFFKKEFDGDTVMRVEFESGAVHDYHGASREAYDDIVGASSAGKRYAEYRKRQPGTSIRVQGSGAEPASRSEARRAAFLQAISAADDSYSVTGTRTNQGAERRSILVSVSRVVRSTIDALVRKVAP